MPIDFQTPSKDKSELESDGLFTPKFDQNGLITAVVTDFSSGDVVMLAHMNAQALALTIETGIAHYYSRSRASLWKKGETSGNLQKVIEMRTDCDQDAVVIKVEMAGDGAACHTGRKSCFYRKVDGLKSSTPTLVTK
jgi:phosphoribosyl-AMP cyclohydrolase